MPKKQGKTNLWGKGLTIFLALLGFIGLLGELGVSGLGRGLYSLFQYLFGELAWSGPFLIFILAGLVRIFTKGNSYNPIKKRGIKPKQEPGQESKEKRSSSQPYQRRSLDRKRKSPKGSIHTEEGFHSGIELPKGKLVALKGFGEYFATSEGPEIGNPGRIEELEDLGRDFSTYFTEGNDFSFKPLSTRLVPVRGFSSYFDEVSAEIEEELRQAGHLDHEPSVPERREWSFISSDFSSKSYPGQVAPLLKLDRKDVAVTPEEREMLLGNPKSLFGRVLEENVQSEEKGGIHIEKDFNSSKEKNVIYPGAEKISDDLPVQSDINEVNEANEANEAIINISIHTNEEYNNEVNKNTKANINVNENKNLNAKANTPETSQVNINAQVSEYANTDTHAKIEAQAIVDLPNIETESKTTGESLKIQATPAPKSWKLPDVDLLDPLPYVPVVHEMETQKQLERVLGDFGVQAKVIRVARGPVITRYELAPAPGVKISRIVNLADDIALGLAARDVRIEAPIPGKAAIGIEVPNKHPRSVPFREVLETPEFKKGASKLRIALGKDIADQPVIADLAKMPHLLVAGATGSGKSVCITVLINSLLTNVRPDEVKFLMVDPKMVELSIYNGIPHLLAPVVTDPKKAAAALKWVVKEMETRYELFAASGVRDIERYNRLKAEEQRAVNPGAEQVPALPWIVVIIDELADLMMVAADEVEEVICRLAQMARAAGIHLVIATQRPSVDVITGVIKANIPSRISFAVSSQIDSRTILDATGAEKLLGRGDMLYSPQGLSKPLRVQGCWVSDDEVQRMISFWKAQGRPEYLDPEGFTSMMSSPKAEGAGPEDELFTEAGRLIITTGMASVSFLQRKLKLGYARAARLMDLLEENGVVGGYEGSKPRQVLLSIEEFEERFG